MVVLSAITMAPRLSLGRMISSVGSARGVQTKHGSIPYQGKEGAFELTIQQEHVNLIRHPFLDLQSLK